MKTRILLPETWECPQVFRDRLGKYAGQQRLMLHDGHLLLILHAPPNPNEISREGRLFYRKPDGSWSSTEKGGKTALLSHLTEFEELLLKLEKIEDSATVSGDYFAVLEELAPVLRTARHLHQVLYDARKAMPTDKDLINFRDKSYQLVRTAELCQTSAKNGLEFSIAKKTEEQAKASHQMANAAHRLNLLAGFFFPLVTIATVYGMQLITVDPKYSTLLFFCLIGIGLICGLVLTGFVSAKSTPEKTENAKTEK